MIDSTCYPEAEKELRAVFDGFTTPIVVCTAHVGSSYMFGLGQDLDICLHVNKLRLDANEVRSLMEGAGYTYTGNSDEYGGVDEDDFMTYRKGDVNIIYTPDPEFYFSMRECSEVVKYLATQNILLTKEQRVKVFRIVMNGESA